MGRANNPPHLHMDMLELNRKLAEDIKAGKPTSLMEHGYQLLSEWRKTMDQAPTEPDFSESPQIISTEIVKKSMHDRTCAWCGEHNIAKGHAYKRIVKKIEGKFACDAVCLQCWIKVITPPTNDD